MIFFKTAWRFPQNHGIYFSFFICYIVTMNIANLLSDVPKDELVDFLCVLAAKNEPIASMIIARFEKTDGKSELSAIKTQVNRIIRRNGDSDGFIDYRASYRFEKEMQSYMQNIFPPLISAGKMWTSFEALCFVFLKFAEPIDIDDSNGTISNLTYEIMGFWEQSINAMADDERKKARSWFEKNMHSEKIIDYMQEYLFNAYTAFFIDEESLFAQIQFIDSYLSFLEDGDTFSDRYECERYAEARIHCMEKLHFSESEIVSFMEKYLEYDNICSIALEKCLADKNYEKAQNLLENLIFANQNRPGIVYEAKEKLLEIYKMVKNEEKTVQTLRWLLLNGQSFEIGLYNEYKSHFLGLYKTDYACWTAEIEKLISENESENEEFAESIFAEEKMYDRLFLSVKKSYERWNSFYELEKYSEILQRDYAADLVQMFKECLEKSAKLASSRPQYAELARHLKNLAKIPSGKEAALSIRDAWLLAYKNRPAMKDELNKVPLD